MIAPSTDRHDRTLESSPWQTLGLFRIRTQLVRGQRLSGLGRSALARARAPKEDGGRRLTIMRVLVAYASRYGTTKGIAERIAERLVAAGLEADVMSVELADEAPDYGAFVVGSAAYMGHWRKEAVDFVRLNWLALAGRPTWLFSCGPLGVDATNSDGKDPRAAAEPKEIAEFREDIAPRDHHVFFGALDPAKLGTRDRLIRTLPAGRSLLPEGDFRDWAEIDAWADGIAATLARVPAGMA
jgi:menaquinone-dependent protoporphyrinogen oxidase